MTGQFKAFNALSAAGREVRLIIGPWTHESLGITGYILREGLAWFDRLLKRSGGQNGNGRGRPQLHLYLMGSRKWIELEKWPPRADLQSWHLHGDASLTRRLPLDAPPRKYTYNPANPTPNLGGGATIVGRTAGSRNQRDRERRQDVLTYTSEALPGALTVVGPSVATVYIRADVDQLDLFVRLCDATPLGRSFNVTDGIVRLKPADIVRSVDGSTAVRISLWPTANTFKAGHRLRLQVSSAAHPMYARNRCTGEALASGIHMKKAQIEVLSDPGHPSAIEIPVIQL